MGPYIDLLHFRNSTSRAKHLIAVFPEDVELNTFFMRDAGIGPRATCSQQLCANHSLSGGRLGCCFAAVRHSNPRGEPDSILWPHTGADQASVFSAHTAHTGKKSKAKG